jgi:hypothetical protein
LGVFPNFFHKKFSLETKIIKLLKKMQKEVNLLRLYRDILRSSRNYKDYNLKNFIRRITSQVKSQLGDSKKSD